MAQISKNETGSEIITAIKNSIDDARDTVRQLDGQFLENARTLRIEESKEVFMSLEQNITDLQHFMEYISVLNNGLNQIGGIGLPVDPISRNNTGIGLFEEMNSALESKDWVVLSDIIEYELAPLLQSEDKWLGELDTTLV